MRLGRAAHFQLLTAQQRLNRLPVSRMEARMAAVLHRLEQRFDDGSQGLEEALNGALRQMQRRVDDLSAAVLRHDPRQRLAHARQHFAAGGTRIDRAMERMLHEEKTRLHALEARLHSLSPLAVLERGYALVLDEQGALVRSAQRVIPGERVFTRLSDGTFTSRVETTTPERQRKKRTK